MIRGPLGDIYSQVHKVTDCPESERDESQGKGNGLPDTVQVHVFTEFARVCRCRSVWLGTRRHCISTYRPVLTKILGKRRVSNEFFVFIVTLYSKEGRKIRWPVNQGSRQTTSAKLLFMNIHCIYLIKKNKMFLASIAVYRKMFLASIAVYSNVHCPST